MSLLVIGISHHNADVESLELLSLDADGRAALLDELCGRENVAEAIVVSTCNRTEVYAEALTFHGAVAEVSELLLQHAGNEAADLAEHLYLHFEDRAIAHAFRVASGLDSMALGESEIRAQLRTALREAQESRHVGPALNTLFQNALRVGKRVHTDTAIGSVSGSLVDAGLRLAGDVVGGEVASRLRGCSSSGPERWRHSRRPPRHGVGHRSPSPTGRWPAGRRWPTASAPERCD